MALPTAQLGQMTTLNVPTSRQVVQTRKEPELWKQALLQIITGAAMEAGKTGVQNVMSQDFAGEFGQDPASTFKRLLQGPAVDRQTAGQMRAEKGADKRQKVAGEQALTLEDLRANYDMLRQKEAQQFTGGENRENRTADMMRLLASESGASSRQQSSEAAAADRLRRQIEAEAATQAAHARLYGTQADQIQQMNEQMRSLMPKATPDKPVETPTTKTPVAPPIPWRSTEVQKFVSDLLAEGVTPEEISANLQIPSGAPAPTPAPVDPAAEVLRQIAIRQNQQTVGNNPNIIQMFRGFGPR